MGEHSKDSRLHQLLVRGDVGLMKEPCRTHVPFSELIDRMILASLFSIRETMAAIQSRLLDRVRLFRSRLVHRTAQKENGDWPGPLAPISSYWRASIGHLINKTASPDLKIKITFLVSSDKDNSSRSHRPQPFPSTYSTLYDRGIS